MIDLIKLVRDLCLRRRGPQDVPYSPLLLLSFIAATLLLDWAVAVWLDMADNFLAQFLLVVSFNLIALNIVLSLRQVRNRFVQTATALSACGLVFSACVIPMQRVIATIPHNTPLQAQDITGPQMLTVWVTLALLVWKVMVDANILRQALNLPAVGGYLLAILGMIAERALLIGVFGDSP